MSTGTGIAILGVWLLPAACALSPTIGTYGYRGSLIMAIIATVLLSHYVG
jgi:hypothetical protein